MASKLLASITSEKPHVSHFNSGVLRQATDTPRPHYQSSITDWIEILSSDRYKENDLDGSVHFPGLVPTVALTSG